MKTKFVVICNNILGDNLVRIYDDSLLDHFRCENVGVQKVQLIDFVGIGKLPMCLADWENYKKVVIICNSATAIFFLDANKIIKNCELWVINWPKKIAGAYDPEKYKFFESMPEMSLEARKLMNS